MKHIKKFASFLLALVMVLAMAIPTYAAEATGSIKINGTDNVSVAGKTFNAYKILDVKDYTAGTEDTAGTVVYTVPEAMKSFYNERYSLTGNEGDYDAQVVAKISAEDDMFSFATAALAAAKIAKIAPTTAKAEESASSVTIKDLPLGYYVVEDTGSNKPVSALILDTTNPNVDVNIKADKPSIDKKIVEGDTEVKHNNAAVGDTVSYKVTSKVPDMTGYKKYYFVINDTLSKGLTFNDDVAIYMGDQTEGNKLAKNAYSVTKSTDQTTGETKVEIVFKDFINYEDRKETPIIVTYSATVNENAVIGDKGNPNTVKLQYSNNPNETVEGDPGNPDKPKNPIGETPESETRTYVTDVELIKVDSKNNRLTGAEFKIEGEKLNTVLVRKDVYTESAEGTYWKLKDGSYTTDDPNGAGMNKDLYEDTSKKYSKSTTTEKTVKAEQVVYKGVVGADGVLRFAGLSAGTYTITEVKAPNGYNLLKDPITVTIGFNTPGTEAATTDGIWSYTWNNGTNNGGNVTSRSNTVTVTNLSGAELPSTGGIGTTIFYVLGSILLIGAVVLLVTKKRMNSEQ